MRLQKRIRSGSAAPDRCRHGIPSQSIWGILVEGPLRCHLDGRRQQRAAPVSQLPRILAAAFCGVQVLGTTVEPTPLVFSCAKWPSTEARRGGRGLDEVGVVLGVVLSTGIR
jgi:hypothetical protein